ncbi:MAG: VWA domain-containing protein [Proteobacteria bacterium]|nr:VWA domain-containing protein [Pseudomonadota bacterium]
MIPSLMFEKREGQLAALERLPRGLWLGSMINSQGSLNGRLDAVDQLHAALLAGCVPDPAKLHWPLGSLGESLCEALTRLELAGFCCDRAGLAQQVVSSMLWHLDLIVDHVDRGDSRADAEAKAVQAFEAEWLERCGLMQELEAVFGDVDDILKNANWDMLQGLLRSSNWREVVRIRGLIERLPELMRFIRQLGRARASEEQDRSSSRDLQVMEQTTAPRTHHRLTRVPDLPGETHGVHRSGRIARMLPAETMLLTHRRLRLIWHARHAERILLSYEEDDRMREVLHEHVPVWQPSPQHRPDARMEAGPMLICVDTSGSMQGGAEAVAKAVVLEAMRAAHAQKRSCHVFVFGGPDEIVELDLGMDESGVERLTEFMNLSFLGGTDVCGPLERALARLTDQEWRLADLLIASDGEFGATPATLKALADAKEVQGLRVRGVLIGDRETPGMRQLADEIFWVRDWRRYGAVSSGIHHQGRGS